MHLMDKEDINHVEDRKERADRSTHHVGQHQPNVKLKERVRLGVRQSNMKLLHLIKEAKEVLADFAKTRGEGAAKIASNAQEKGGLALLTWHHFKVKLPYYKKATEGKLDFEKAKQEYTDTYKKISLDMTQIEFQREVGRLEVLGELLIRNK
jgi:hypothetical protein